MDAAWPSAASTGSTTPGTAICPAKARWARAGFGLGFERTLAYVAGLAKMRDAIPFPRTPGNAQYSCVLLGDRVCVRRRLALDAYGAVTATRGFRFVRSATDSPNSDPSLRT